MEDPIGKTLLSTELDNELELYKVSCPIGIIGIILNQDRMLWFRSPHFVLKAVMLYFLKAAEKLL